MRNHYIIILSFLSLFASLIFAIPLAQFQIPYFSPGEKKSFFYFIQGVNLYNESSYETARNFFLKSLNLTPNFYFARRFLADSYYLSGELESSLDEYEILKNQYPYDEYLTYKIQQIENQLLHFNRKYLQESSSKYIYWKTVSANNLPIQNFVPIDIEKDEKYIYCLNYSPPEIYIFDYEGNWKNYIKGNFLSSLQKPYDMTIDKDRIYVSDFGSDEIYVFNKTTYRYEYKISPISYPSNILIINHILYIWSKSQKKFYKFTLDGTPIGDLTLQSAVDSIQSIVYTNQSHSMDFSDFATDGENIYATYQNKIMIFDISGTLRKEISIPTKNIKHLFIQYPILSVIDSEQNILYTNFNTMIQTDKYNWNFIHSFFVPDSQELYHLKKDKIRFQEKKFYHISNIFMDPDFIYITDLSGKIHFLMADRITNQNLDLQILNIEANHYPDIAIRIRISSSNRKETFDNLEQHHFEIYENDKPIPILNPRNMDMFKNRLNILFIRDPSFQIQNFEYEPTLKENLLQLFDQFKINDTVFVGVIEDGLKIVYKGKYKLEIYEILKNFPILSQSKRNMISSLIQGIQFLLPLKGKKAIVFLTNNHYTSYEFEQWEKMLHLSYIHSIPVYIITFNHQNPILEKIANSTNGKQFYFFDNYYFKDIYQHIEKQNFSHYLITYEAPTKYHKKLKDQYINVKVKIKFLQYGGVAEGGYIVP